MRVCLYQKIELEVICETNEVQKYKPDKKITEIPFSTDVFVMKKLKGCKRGKQNKRMDETFQSDDELKRRFFYGLCVRGERKNTIINNDNT